GTTFELVGVARRPVLAPVELGRDVEQEAARCEPLGIERAGVEDRLPSRARLAGAIARDVVLGFELRACDVVARVAGAAHVREDVPGSVVERYERSGVQILSAQVAEP